MLLLCSLLGSGRTHQIRVHAAHAGFPLVSDSMYGGAALGTDGAQDAPSLARVALHAWRLRIIHPATREPLVIEAPPAADLRRCLAALGLSFGDPRGST